MMTGVSLDMLKVSVIIIVMTRRLTDITDDAKRMIMEFINDLKTGIFTSPAEQLELTFVEAYYASVDSESAIQHLISNVLPYKDQIKKRNLHFFIDKKDVIFKGLPQARIDHFANMVTKPEELGGIDGETKRVVWDYFDTFLWLAEEYKKKC